jgi:hypothetical protein
MKVYTATRHEPNEQPEVIVIDANAPPPRVNPLHHWSCHSPDGFEMGYAGSGPADLALAILSDHLGVDPDLDYTKLGSGDDELANKAYRLHQDFKVDWITRSRDALTITGGDIDDWLDARG